MCHDIPAQLQEFPQRERSENPNTDEGKRQPNDTPRCHLVRSPTRMQQVHAASQTRVANVVRPVTPPAGPYNVGAANTPAFFAFMT